jgi:hypothetical protein
MMYLFANLKFEALNPRIKEIRFGGTLETCLDWILCSNDYMAF